MTIKSISLTFLMACMAMGAQAEDRLIDISGNNNANNYKTYDQPIDLAAVPFVYNLSGMKVATANEWDRLPKGVYVLQGKLISR